MEIFIRLERGDDNRHQDPPLVSDVRVLEFGSGQRPRARPHVDDTPSPFVDYVAPDLTNTELAAEHSLVVFSSFVLDRLSWRKSVAFLKECFRVTKPGGKLAAVCTCTGAALEEVLAACKDDFARASELLFGRQDGKDVSRLAFWTPKTLEDAARQAGWGDIKVEMGHDSSPPVLLMQAYRPPELRTKEIAWGGHTIRVHDPESDGVTQEVEGNDYEGFENEVMARYVQKGDFVIDVGAHVGFSTIVLADLVGHEGLVHAFEPEPANFELLKHNTKSMYNVLQHNSALSDRSGKTYLYMTTGNTGDNRLWEQKHTHRRKVEVVTTRGDDCFTPNYAVQFIKIDTQGAECRVLEGLKETMAQQKRLALLCEYWPFGMAGMGDSVGRYWSYFEGYDAFKIDGLAKRLVPVTDRLGLIDPKADTFCNLLLVKR